MHPYIATLLAFACAAAAGNALADDISVDPHPFVSSVSRAQVQEELRQFRQAGVNPWSDDYNPLAGSAGTGSRAEATAAFLAARDLVAAFAGEDSGSSYLARMAHAGARPAATELARAE